MDKAKTNERRTVGEVQAKAYAAFDLLEACALQLPPSDAIAALVDRILALRREFTKVAEESRRND